MAGKHWIITNRPVVRKRVGGAMVERVNPDEHTALPVFRIATYTPPANAEGMTGEQLEAFVEFVPDEYVSGYDGIGPGDDPTSMRGTRRLFTELYQTMRDAPVEKGDSMFFMHGFDYGWYDSLAHLQRLHEVYSVPDSSPVGQLLYFSWPGYGDLGRYPSDQRIAQPSGALLGRIYAKALQFYREFFGDPANSPEFCGKEIHLAAHSMGNMVLQEFMRSIVDYRFLRANIFGQTLLLNSDIDWDSLEPGHPLYSLPEYCNRVHVYTHADDDALWISENTKSEHDKRLGRHGPKDWRVICPRTMIVDTTRLDGTFASAAGADRYYADAVASLSPARQARDEAVAAHVLGSAPRGRDVNLRERMFDHWGYLHRPEIIADVYQVLQGISTPEVLRRELREGPLYRLQRR
jgi:esterase/lipase superfamily enzyme